MSCLVFYIDKTASHKHIGNSRERLTAGKDPHLDPWCNGSTADFGSAGSGPNPEGSTSRAFSSTGKSSGLIIRRLQVQALQGPPIGYIIPDFCRPNPCIR